MSVNYLDYFTPGLVGYMTFMTFQLALVFVRHDRTSGMLGIIVLSKGSLANYLGGKLLAQTIINLMKCLILVILSIIISGGHIYISYPLNAIAFIFAIILGTSTWLCLGVSLALRIKREDMREIIVMLLSMPLTFSSSMYYDISKAPSWIKAISIINPLTYTCDIARSAYLSESINIDSYKLIILFIMAIISIGIAIFLSRRQEY
jgi:ABC-2 type transport system permease protein